jgi:acetyl-CoA acetyltransferase
MEIHMDPTKINEAFATQTLACVCHLNLNEELLDVNGRAEALGHLLWSNGGKLGVQVVYEMRRQRAKYGLASMCIDGG